MSISAAVVRRLMRELTELKKNPPEGIRVQTSEEDILDISGILEGPDGTPYAGGFFKVRFKFTEEFPAAPPKCWFATKIFHPNVGGNGEICVNTLKKDWKSNYGIGHILVTVKCLLIYPNPESALDEEAGKLLLEDYSSYCDRAKLITSVHATPRVRPVEFDTPAAPPDEPSPPPKEVDLTSTSATPPTASTSKFSNSLPMISTSVSSPPPSLPASTPFTLPIVTRKSASPAPQPRALKSTLSPEKEGIILVKERHPSPSPLGTADANVGSTGKPAMGLGMGVAPGITSGTKAVKRAATGSGATGAEKRKKALKRL